MSLRFNCSNCGQEITVKYLKPGEMALCKNCDGEMTVPDDAAQAENSSPHTESASDTEATDVLNSEGLGKILIILLWVGLAVAIVLFALAFYLKGSLSPLTHSNAGWALIVLILLAGPVFVVQAIVFLLWLVRVHMDLKRFYPDYPITPGKAVACLLIPVYHIWGVWNVFSSMSKRMKHENTEIDRRVNELSRWIIPLVITFILDYVVLAEMIVGSIGTAQTLTYESMFSNWDVAAFAVGVLSAIIYLRMAVLVQAVLRLKQQV